MYHQPPLSLGEDTKCRKMGSQKLRQNEDKENEVKCVENENTKIEANLLHSQLLSSTSSQFGSRTHKLRRYKAWQNENKKNEAK